MLKFTRAGRFLMQIGKRGMSHGDADTHNLNRPADTRVDPSINELYVADGYGNHRVIVFDAGSGAYQRHWGAHGRPPGDSSVKPFGNPVHCVRIARDGLVYVCDRRHNRMLARGSGKILSQFGRSGRYAGQLHWVHNLAVDGKGNIYTTEVDHAKRVQKFAYQGLSPVGE